jgi:hypothetical protein
MQNVGQHQLQQHKLSQQQAIHRLYSVKVEADDIRLQLRQCEACSGLLLAELVLLQLMLA